MVSDHHIAFALMQWAKEFATIHALYGPDWGDGTEQPSKVWIEFKEDLDIDGIILWEGLDYEQYMQFITETAPLLQEQGWTVAYDIPCNLPSVQE